MIMLHDLAVTVLVGLYEAEHLYKVVVAQAYGCLATRTLYGLFRQIHEEKLDGHRTCHTRPGVDALALVDLAHSALSDRRA